jgi:hypothetical protein
MRGEHLVLLACSPKLRARPMRWCCLSCEGRLTRSTNTTIMLSDRSVLLIKHDSLPVIRGGKLKVARSRWRGSNSGTFRAHYRQPKVSSVPPLDAASQLHCTNIHLWGDRQRSIQIGSTDTVDEHRETGWMTRPWVADHSVKENQRMCFA